jgi:hypothetical protein
MLPFPSRSKSEFIGEEEEEEEEEDGRCSNRIGE